jgi:hypothetical protein
MRQIAAGKFAGQNGPYAGRIGYFVVFAQGENTMKKIAITGFVGLLVAGAAVVQAEETPSLPGPAKEHEWLQQLVGEWDSESEMIMEPGAPPQKSKGTESVRAIGGFWVMAENKGDVLGTPVTGILTLGYDAQKQKYVGTWVDSMTGYLWTYEGTLDEAGKVLTLETEGPNFTGAGTARFKDVIEVKSKDHKVLTSSMQGEDGEWVTFMTAQYRRKE